MIAYPAGKLDGSYTIPDSVTRVEGGAFVDCYSLLAVTIPSSVKSIEEGAFYACTSLTGVTIPGSVTSIGDYAFSDCPKLVQASFMGNAPSLGTGVFENAASGFNVYYASTALGFTSPWNGYTTVRLPSTNADLSALSITGATLSPAFTSSGTNYTITVANSVTSVIITTTKSDTAATTQVTGSTGLIVGSNTATVRVTAEDGITVKIYTIIVTRQASANANLSMLLIGGGVLSPAFGSLGTNYTATVANSVTSVVVTPTVSDPLATVQVTGSTGLIVGNNTVTVRVTAPDRTTTKTYTIIVTRQASANADLSVLAISGGTLSPAFGPLGTYYTATVSNSTTAVSVTHTVADSTATAQVLGGTALTVGSNTITVTVTAQNHTTTKTYTITVTRQASANANLSMLLINGAMLSPAFYSLNTYYTATVANSVTSVVVTPTVFDPLATVQVTGSTGLIVGNNTVTVRVTAPDRTTTKTYTIVVTRQPSANADLATLSITSGTLSPAFVSGSTNYTATVPNDVTSVTVTDSPDDPLASAQVTGGTGLIVGNNTITVRVTAPDHMTFKTYTIVVNRLPSDNADLSALAITSGTLSPGFVSTGTSYTATVQNSVTNLTVTSALSDSTATVQVIGGTGLIVGNNTIAVKVTAQDATTIKTYRIVVKRLPSANASLSALAITSGTLNPVFVSTGTSYTATVPNNVTLVTVTRTASDSTATVLVTGGTGLVVGSNTITVKVTAQDGTTTKTYRVVVTREAGPVAVNDTVVAHGAAITFDPRVNDRDPKGRALQITSAAVAGFGTVTRTGTSVSYRPGANYAGHDSFLYTISNGFGGTASATVTVTEPTVALSGTYRGILTVSGTASGFCTMSVGATGAFSATVYLSAEKQVIAGVFNPQGYFVQPVVVSGKALNLVLRIAPGTNLVVGTIASGAKTWSASLARTYTATTPTPLAGNYTVLFPLNTTLAGQAAYPQGTGYATMTVNSNGTAILTGKLGDGTPISIASSLDNAGKLPVFQALSSGSGAYLAGVITFGNVLNVSDAAGTLHWVKPPQSVAQAYQAGFGINVGAIASKFPSATPVLGKSGTMTLKGGTMIGTLTKTVTIPASGGTLAITPSGTDGIVMTVNATTGLITGTFLPGTLASPADATRRLIYGVLFPKQNAAAGLFVQPTKTGQFRIGLK